MTANCRDEHNIGVNTRPPKSEEEANAVCVAALRQSHSLELLLDAVSKLFSSLRPMLTVSRLWKCRLAQMSWQDARSPASKNTWALASTPS